VKFNLKQFKKIHVTYLIRMIYPSKYLAPSLKVNVPLPNKPSCRNCVYFIDKKSTEFATIGVCKLFQYKLTSPKGNMEYYADVDLVRSDSNLCGKDGEYYKRTALAVRKFDHVDQTSEYKAISSALWPHEYKVTALAVQPSESTITELLENWKETHYSYTQDGIILKDHKEHTLNAPPTRF
jgi:hypothetical protein